MAHRTANRREESNRSGVATNTTSLDNVEMLVPRPATWADVKSFYPAIGYGICIKLQSTTGLKQLEWLP